MREDKKVLEFDWDEGNIGKSLKHKVESKEAEEVFFDENKQEYPDPKHSEKEVRKLVVGKTKKGRLLFIVYTIRKKSIRIISARDLNKRREADLYEKAT
jgi:uncharacterized DUF497 family protein